MSGTIGRDLRAAKRELAGRYLRGGRGTAIAEARAAYSAVQPGPRPQDNVVGVGIGEKVVLNQLAAALCVKVYVRRKYANAEIAGEARIPAMLDGIPTDVEEVGAIRPRLTPCTAARRGRQRPAPCGISVGHIGVSAGTLGALVRDSGREDNGRRYILSNNHVLANANDAQTGDAILQPGPFDGGRADDDRIATLVRFVRLNFRNRDNAVDCAIAEVEDGAVLPNICSLGAVAGTTRPARNLTVMKHGRTTGLTRGVITDTDADIRVDFGDAGTALFINTVLIRGLPPTTPFSDGGDSGSLIVDSARRACALLFAGSVTTDVTFANPIATVLRRLRVRLI